MKIKKIVSQSRRDFTAIYECESCEATHEGSGYDDGYFHNNVIPAMECAQCGEKAPPSFRGLAPKHPADAVL